MLFMSKKETLDLLQEKRKRLGELALRSDAAVQMVQTAINNLKVVSQDIEETMSEIDTYLERLNVTRSSLGTTHDKNQKIMQNLSQLLCLE